MRKSLRCEKCDKRYCEGCQYEFWEPGGESLEWPNIKSDEEMEMTEEYAY